MLVLLEIAHRLIYQSMDPWGGSPWPARAEDCLRILRGKDIGEKELPTGARLASQSALCERLGIEAVYRGAPHYPPALLQLPEPPPVLFFQGELPAPQLRQVAIVGSRRASRAGLEMAARLGRGAAAAGLPVVSGLARGIDQAAHRACLERERSWAVLGCGLDIVYPPEASGLAAALRRQGGLISEFPPGCPPLPFHFPRRNRLMAALSSAVLVVEAGAKSGALSTAKAALELGRELGVVPSNPLNPSAQGSNRLLRDGAVPVLDVDDLLALAGASRLPDRAPAPWNAARCRTEGVGDLETLAVRTGWLLTECIEALTRWEREGEILRLPRGRFQVLDALR